MSTSSYPEVETVAVGVLGNIYAPREEDTSSWPARDDYSIKGDKDKGPIDEGNDSGSEIDPEDLKIINGGPLRSK